MAGAVHVVSEHENQVEQLLEILGVLQVSRGCRNSFDGLFDVDMNVVVSLSGSNERHDKRDSVNPAKFPSHLIDAVKDTLEGHLENETLQTLLVAINR